MEAHTAITEATGFFGLRYVRDELTGVRWTTELVFSESAEGNAVSVGVHVDSSATVLKLPPAKKPYVVRQLVADFGGGDDGILAVADRPILLSSDEVAFAASIIDGEGGNSLPVVYLSSFADSKFSVDPKLLSQWLSGVAHVVVEPDRHFSHRLAIEVNHRNAYGGAVGIYWPDRAMRSLILPRDFDFEPRAIAREIARVIRDRAVRLRMPRNLTWSNLQECKARTQLENLRNRGSRDLEEYVQSFDQEIEAKDQALAEAEAEIRRLESEVLSLRSRFKTVEGQPILVRGVESDLYEDESLCFLVDAINVAIDNSPPTSRRRDVLRSIVAANPLEEDHRQQYATTIKRVMSTFRSLEPSVAHELEQLGFEITSEGKHHKMVFRDDNRYQVSLPKTSSDHRAGRNLVSEIKSLLF